MAPKQSKLTRYIKDTEGEKTEMKTTSVNVTLEQHKFVMRKNLNLSLITRDAVDALMKGEKE